MLFKKTAKICSHLICYLKLTCNSADAAIYTNLINYFWIELKSHFLISYIGFVYSWGMGSNYQLGTGEDDEYTPVKIVSKQLEDRKAFTSSGGGQHAVILACDK